MQFKKQISTLRSIWNFKSQWLSFSLPKSLQINGDKPSVHELVKNKIAFEESMKDKYHQVKLLDWRKCSKQMISLSEYNHAHVKKIVKQQ